MKKYQRQNGEIRIPAGVTIWKHELSTAEALAAAGYVVEFLAVKDFRGAKSPDIIMANEAWELKSPRTDKLSAVERNLKRGTKQSGNVIIDSQRMQKIHDSTVERYLTQKFKQQRTIKKLVFVNRRRNVIDISKKISL